MLPIFRILSGRRINDGMGSFIAQRLVKLLIAAERVTALLFR